jgi:hypothetical protein
MKSENKGNVKAEYKPPGRKDFEDNDGECSYIRKASGIGN